MFTVYCKRHGTNVLLGDDDILSVANDERGIVVSWKCYCGQRGAVVHRHHRRHPTFVA
jgi:hypothetical protein